MHDMILLFASKFYIMKSMLTTLCILYCTLNFAQTQIIPVNDKFKLLESDYLKIENDAVVATGHETETMSVALPLTFSGTKNTIEYTIEYEGEEPNTFGALYYYLSTGDIVKVFHERDNNLSVDYSLTKYSDDLAILGWRTFKRPSGQQNIKIVANGKSFKVYVNDKKETSLKTLGGEIKKVLVFTKNGEKYKWKITKMSASNVAFEEVKQLDLGLTKNPKKLVAASSEKYSDLSPKITADGKVIYFTRDINNIDKAMFCEKQEDGSWSEAKMLPSPINLNGKNVSITSVGIDGFTVYTTGYRTKHGLHDKKEGVSRTTLGPDGYEAFVPYEIKKYVNDGKYRTFFLSADRQFLIVGIQGKVNHGQQDLYVCFLVEKKKNKGYYTEPLNLGTTVNTAGSDMFGFLAPDNRTLYISSNGHHGYGDNDFFITKRLDETWTKWTTPVNLGPVINTTDWDGYFTTDASGEMALISADREDGENEDIYEVKLAEEVKPDPVLIVSGKVLNKETNDPVDAEIIFRPISNKDAELQTTRANKKSGEYKVVFQKGSNYEILATREGYFPTSDYIKLDSLETFGEITKNLYLTEIKKGEVIRLNNIFFDFAKASLKEESFYELDRLVDLLVKNKKLRIKISGHTDNKGSESYNTKLSNERAQSVVNYLVSKGIDVARLEFEGYGPSKPVDTNDTEEGRANNRRVEFTIL
jgi:outer membrane protein OmpA-like peptidoglycan-associated protein